MIFENLRNWQEDSCSLSIFSLKLLKLLSFQFPFGRWINWVRWIVKIHIHFLFGLFWQKHIFCIFYCITNSYFASWILKCLRTSKKFMLEFSRKCLLRLRLPIFVIFHVSNFSVLQSKTLLTYFTIPKNMCRMLCSFWKKFEHTLSRKEKLGKTRRFQPIIEECFRRVNCSS